MAQLSLKHVYKAYFLDGKEKRKAEKAGRHPYFLAVKDFNLEIKDGEFVVFVGPSGCGKSTTLRMIAGLEEISQGELYIGDRLMNDVSPKDRDIAMVFQNYALYPQMTCYQNIAFALKLQKILVPTLDQEGNRVKGINKRKVNELKKQLSALEKDHKKIPDSEPEMKQHSQESIESTKKQLDYFEHTEVELDHYRHYTKQEIDGRVRKVAKILDIEAQLDKKPGAMSGGQRQRVALGRAIVRDPKVFLLDEPLSNLDAKLRGQMRVEITRLHKSLGTTFIYVTHDQVEAMTMGDKIVVMKEGVIQQVDTPTNLFDYPANVFVASFIGTPQMNFYRANLKAEGNQLTLVFQNGDIVSGSKEEFPPIEESWLAKEGKDVIVGVRGEHIDPEGKDGPKAQVTFVESLGLETNIYAKFANPMDSFLNAPNPIVIKVPKRVSIKTGDELTLGFSPSTFHFFDPETQLSIVKKPEETKENPEVKEKFQKELEKKEQA